MRTTLLIIAFCLSSALIVAQNIAPKNIIILISDGGGYNQMLAADYYLGGKSGMAPFDTFKVRLAMSTYPAVKFEGGACSYDPASFWADFDYARRGFTESAAAASAMATGIKTRNGRIGTDVQGRPLTNVSEVAKARGKSVGIVTSVQFCHATPAGFLVHNAWRSNYKDIALDMLFSSQADVVMGAGSPLFDDNGMPNSKGDYRFVGGPEVWAFLQKTSAVDCLINGSLLQVQDVDGDMHPDPWTLISDRKELQKLATADVVPERVIAIAPVATTLSQRRDSLHVNPYSVPVNPQVFTLGEMSNAALNVLNGNEQGFFLMVEGGAIDWANHDNDLGSMIEEMAAFYNMADTVMRWVEQNSSWTETLLIITSDHECGYLWGPGSGDSTFAPIGNQGKGILPQAQYYSSNHSNSLVPFFAYGCGADRFLAMADESDSVRGAFLTNSEIAQQIKQWWGNHAGLYPAMVNADNSSSMRLTATAPYAGATYQWYLDGMPIKGANHESTEIVPSKLGVEAKLFCRVFIGALQYDTPFLVIQP